MDWIAKLFEPQVLLPFLTFVIPGFIVWVVLQSRLPRGAQQFNDALLEILTYGLVNAILWTLLGRAPITWTAWPTTWGNGLWLAATAFVSPLLIAVLYEQLLRLLARFDIILPLEPRAWERLFLAVLPKKSCAMIVTLKDGTKVAGAYINDGYSGLYPYQSDLFLSEVWKLDNEGRFEARIGGTSGVYVDKSDILLVELFEYQAVIDAATARKRAREEKDVEGTSKGEGDHTASG